ncbi:hypothetical protein Y900_026700 [Mycolicibacterium aromaticivorans JS19b1 = JCM 16368]|uniref:Uncharacterized protein n=1 Tax=Mycolicibacterium aromaticivorans JS19b1 = JCM 16368 TaxID=1440774 RepID=A0A064CUE0_9MYCO|nr:hypothetical protein [Mycolicibacterium aromaticivorans]KDF02428.1 hypothetical protein Y900_026700 [Mycolicibacterium aromaticivorans JS19b1 = JCM 16368]
MTTLSPPPIHENILQFSEPEHEPPSRRRWVLPRSRRAKAAVAGGLSAVLVAGVLGATYETSPGGALWGVEKSVFPEHSQDVALTAVVSDLKQAQDILASGQQPTPDQLTDARNSLNQAKQNLDYLSASPQRTSLQNLYLQLTQELQQYTPDSAQELPPLPVPTATPLATAPDDPSQTPDVALMNASAPSWGYPITDESGTLPPPGVPDAPLADWPQPYAPPLTPNLGDLGYYDPSWDQLYGYDAGDWYNYDLGGYNRYGYDFLGFDRWGYDRWGYDRWGYDHWGYNWAGYNWAGYDRDGWDRDGRNDWGQRRDHAGDPRNQDWYNGHHPYEQYYQWRFRGNDPVYRRTQWDQAHGVNRNLYQDWNLNRDWHNPRNRDWAPIPGPRPVTDVDIHASAPVVNLNASLTQFISTSKATDARPLMKDLADKSARDFAGELNPRVTIPIDARHVQTLDELRGSSDAAHQPSAAPPALTEPAPAVAPSKVSPGFNTPKLSPVPAYTPPKAARPQGKPELAPADAPRGPDRDQSSGPPAAIPPKADTPDPVVAPPAHSTPTTRPDPVAAPALQDATPRRADAVPQAPESGRQDPPAAPVQQEPRQRAAPEQPARDTPAPSVQASKANAPAPKSEAPQDPPIRQVPVHQAPARAPEPAPEQPSRQAPVAPDAHPPVQPSAPEQRQAAKCALPAMC